MREEKELKEQDWKGVLSNKVALNSLTHSPQSLFSCFGVVVLGCFLRVMIVYFCCCYIVFLVCFVLGLLFFVVGLFCVVGFCLFFVGGWGVVGFVFWGARGLYLCRGWWGGGSHFLWVK